MSQNFGNAFLKKPAHPDGANGLKLPVGRVVPAPKPAAPRPPASNPLASNPLVPKSPAAKPPVPRLTAPRQTYTRIFRWRLPDGQTRAPATVEIVGTFTNWQKVPLTRDGVLDAWHVALHNLQCGRMHHYMLLVDGQPVRDKHCDGLAVPNGPQEEQYQLATDRGPRVLMLFAQSK